ncbi:glycoside hydrolase family 15 [Aureimonas endophytica]|uniref:Glycoside hydrolase family 15 n=1 Tax=Aureimonas endophytica TaxID=2027858 RepID=A0A916ZJF6_9HYPH|nr:glycoside hydrolase family 15 protein [Aureimonas endophytica]GGD99417.1 glycoside hydrolase family 15 [Aureimonas endophytica]
MKPYPRTGEMPDRRRLAGLPLESYAALGDGRSVALSGADGSIDWWCVPNMDSPPLFDRLLAEESGGCFIVAPRQPFTVARGYRPGSNVFETVFTTATGRAKLTESMNSGHAGRLPWCELARRIEGLDGTVDFELRLVFGTRADTICPFLARNDNATTFNAGEVTGLLRHSDGVTLDFEDDLEIRGSFTLRPGDRETVAIIAGENEPLIAASVEEIDRRIDIADAEWRQWSDDIGYSGKFGEAVNRSALALKLLLYSPSGAIAAAATTSLPEGFGSGKNYDYRYAWVRDASYTIKAFLRIGAKAEAKAAFSWLIKCLDTHGPHVCYDLQGGLAEDVREYDLPGYRGERPVVAGNQAAKQHQHGIFGDIFETAARFVGNGHILDRRSGAVLASLADLAVESWRTKDSGIWELSELRDYTMSKISAWQGLARAVELADGGHIPATCRDRWARGRDRIAAWIDANCWSEAKQSYVFHPGCDTIDASLALAVRFGFDGRDRLEKTIRAIDRELGAGPFHYRYGGVENDEGCFLACTFWVLEGLALLGHRDEAERRFAEVLAALDTGCGIYAEMVAPDSGTYLGNLPQGLTHLALIQTAATLSGQALS